MPKYSANFLSFTQKLINALPGGTSKQSLQVQFGVLTTSGQIFPKSILDSLNTLFPQILRNDASIFVPGESEPPEYGLYRMGTLVDMLDTVGTHTTQINSLTTQTTTNTKKIEIISAEAFKDDGCCANNTKSIEELIVDVHNVTECCANNTHLAEVLAFKAFVASQKINTLDIGVRNNSRNIDHLNNTVIGIKDDTLYGKFHKTFAICADNNQFNSTEGCDTPSKRLLQDYRDHLGLNTTSCAEECGPNFDVSCATIVACAQTFEGCSYDRDCSPESFTNLNELNPLFGEAAADEGCNPYFD